MRSLWQNLEMWLIGVQKRGERGFLTSLLWAASQIVRFMTYLRNFFYDTQLLSTISLPIPVISVGNIVAGGVGKTPFVSRLLEDLGLPIGVLSRGYRAKVRGPIRIVSEPNDGDEAFLLAKRNQNGIVFVGKNRIQSSLYAIEKGATCIILDDGMQYRKLHRDFEVVVMHADNPFGHGHFLPRGMLRDSPKRLKKASLVVIHGAQDQAKFQIIEKNIRQITRAPIIGTKYRIEDQKSLKGGKIGAFCGIGTPEPFYQMLEESGYEVLAKRTLPDHAAFIGVEDFVADCFKKGATEVLCTEKDFVKLQNTAHIRPLKVHTEVEYGSAHYQEFLNQIKLSINVNNKLNANKQNKVQT